MPRSPLTHHLEITQHFMENPANYPGTHGHPGTDFRSPADDQYVSCVEGFVNIYNRYPWEYAAPSRLNPNPGQPGYRGYGAVICVDWWS